MGYKYPILPSVTWPPAKNIIFDDHVAAPWATVKLFSINEALALNVTADFLKIIDIPIALREVDAPHTALLLRVIFPIPAVNNEKLPLNVAKLLCADFPLAENIPFGLNIDTDCLRGLLFTGHDNIAENNAELFFLAELIIDKDENGINVAILFVADFDIPVKDEKGPNVAKLLF